MSTQVWKFPLDVASAAQSYSPWAGTFEIPMPKGAKVIHAGMTGAQASPCIWAVCDSDRDEVIRTFAVKMTGENMEDILDGSPKYVASFSYAGNMVWHLFEVM